MQPQPRKSLSTSFAVTAGLAACLIVAAWLAQVSESTVAPQAENPERLPMMGVATGEFADGMAVYRFPTIIVSARRSIERVQIVQEDALAHARFSPALAAQEDSSME